MEYATRGPKEKGEKLKNIIQNERNVQKKGGEDITGHHALNAPQQLVHILHRENLGGVLQVFDGGLINLSNPMRWLPRVIPYGVRLVIC